jgi:hypothetical protein
MFEKSQIDFKILKEKVRLYPEIEGGEKRERDMNFSKS